MVQTRTLEVHGGFVSPDAMERDDDTASEDSVDRLAKEARQISGKRVVKAKDPKQWTHGLFECCSLPPKQGCPCCITNICCGPCAFGNAMELAELGDIWPGFCAKVCERGGRCCPSHLVGDQCLLTCALACDLHLNCAYSLWASKQIADKYGIAYDPKKEALEAILCPVCFRWKITHEIMAREKLVYFSECGLCEIIREPEEDEEKKEEGDEKLDVDVVSAKGAPAVAEMAR